MVKLPEYILNQDFTLGSLGSEITLPQGACLKPIQTRYLPTHILKSDKHRWFDESTHTYCYCSLGLIPIPDSLITLVTWG